MRKPGSKIIYFFLLILWIPSDAMCRWVSRLMASTEQEITCTVSAVDESRLVVNVACAGFAVEQDSLFPAFSTICIPGCEVSVDPQCPQLPVINRLLVIPDGRELVIDHIDVTEQNYSGAEAMMTGTVKPAPVYTRVGEAPQSLVAETGRVYQTNQFYPAETVRIYPGGIMRGRRIARLQIMPVHYNPVSGDIRFITRLECRLRLTDPAIAQPRAAKPASTGPLFNRLLNETGNTIQSLPGDLELWTPPGYLLITPDAFAEQAALLAEWKTQKGYKVTIATLSHTGGSAGAIRNYIRQAYTTWPTPPDFVLLAGDITHIPAFNGQFSLNPHVPHITDLYYATMDGDDDIFPDILVGRLPAADTTQLRSMIDKIIAYEELIAPDRSWLDHATFIATRDKNFHEFVEKGHRNSINRYCTPIAVAGDSIWTFNNDDRQQLNDAVDRGSAMVVYSGHGSETYWSDLDDYSLVELYYLQNTGRYPLTLSFGCNAGDFAYKIQGGMECLGESFLSYEQRGAVLFWGASAVSFWHQDYYLQEQFFQAAFDKQYESFGQAAIDALLQLYSRGYPYSDFYMEVYNILGDPSLPLWRGAPEILEVAHPETLAAGAERLEVQVTDEHGPVDGAVTALSQNNVLIGAAMTHNGHAVVALEQPLSTDNALLTVSKNRHLLYRYNFTVPEPPRVTFTPDTLTANVQQLLHIDVADNSGAPLANYLISIHGIGLDSSIQAVTDADGAADIEINCPYGQPLYIYGSKPADPAPDYTGRLPVRSALDFSAITIVAAAPFIGLDSSLAPGVPGEISVAAFPEPERIFVSGCGLDTVFIGYTFTIVPKQAGKITFSLGTTGYTLYQTDITVGNAAAGLSGIVYRQTDSLTIAETFVYLRHVLSGQEYSATSDKNGVFGFTEMIAGYYFIYVYRQGYSAYADSMWLAAGQNELPLYLQPAQSKMIGGSVLLSDMNDHTGTVVGIRGQGLADTTSGSGEFLLSGVIADTVILAVRHDGYVPQKRQLVLNDGDYFGDCNFILVPGTSVVDESFETDAGDFTGSGLWQWGVPEPGLYYHAPDQAHSGRRVWGTVLKGDYTPFADYKLDSPEISLAGFVAPFLQFYHYYCMDYLNTCYDGGNVQLSDDGGVLWLVIHPLEGYTCDSLSAENLALAGQPGFSGCISVWQKVQFDLTPWADKKIRLRFHFGSTGQAEDAGWYIDDFFVFDKTTVNIADQHDEKPSRFDFWQNYPNPFNAETVIGYELPENSFVEMTVYNMLGQKVKTLVAEPQQPGRYRARWQGTDEQGRPVSAGIYLVQFRAGTYSGIKKITLLR
ncbi:MAG TPA: C25 family cysteine peptidase [bacterium]|nr:C25 family cysteine peptidase [bacterium]HPN45172.1 C25 family cysteine peptidase [bacterium]